MPEDGRDSYLKEIQDKSATLLTRFENTPASSDNKHLRWRLAADIEQTKWRVNYLKDVV